MVTYSCTMLLLAIDAGENRNMRSGSAVSNNGTFTTSGQYSIAVMLTVVLAMVAVATLAVFASSASAQEEQEDKSILCHRTGSEENPFLVIEVDGSSIPGAHSGHGDFILGPASEFEGMTQEQLEEACAEADPRTTAADDQYDDTTAADDQYDATTGKVIDTTTAKDAVISKKKIIDIPKQKDIPSEKKIIDVPKQKVLIDTGGPPLLLLGAALMCLAGAGIAGQLLRVLRR